MVLVGLALILVSKFVFLPIRIQGVSMLPTYKENRVNFVNRLSYAFHEPQRGDVVAIRLAGQSIMFLKRVVGMPGETIGFHAGQCYIDGEPLTEPYVKSACSWESPDQRLGPGEYYVVGDNRDMASFEHTQGIALRQRIVVKILL